MKKHYLLFVTFFAAFNSFIYSQYTPIDYVTVDNSKYILQDLVKQVLVKEPCMAVSDISSTQSCGIAYFNRNDSNFPFKEGMIIRTGEAAKS